MRRVDEFQRRRDLIHNELKEVYEEGFYKPAGGFYYFLPIDKFVSEGTTNDEIEDRFIEHGIGLIAGSAFSVGDRYNNYVRLSFSHTPTDQIKAGIKRFKEALHSFK
jgi:aspartate/methionine/tyrosine aminotransferase